MNHLDIIIKHLLKEENFNKYYNYLPKQIQPEYKTILDNLEWFHDVENTSPTIDALEFYTLSKGKAKDAELYSRIFENIRNVSVPESAVEEYFTELKHRALATELAVASLEFSEGNKKLEDIIHIYNKFEIINKQNFDIDFVTTSLSEIYSNYIKPEGFRWRLKSLNESLGSLRKGDFGFIFARPESGKTTFLISEISNMLEKVVEFDMDPIVWFNNEEQGSKVMFRFIQGLFGLSTIDLIREIEHHDKVFREIYGPKFKLYDSATISSREVERICNILQPSLIIFDQIDKIKGFHADRDDLRLGYLYQWARELAKEHCPIIAVCQADGSGEGMKWLTMENVALAKTAKQAEADFILGIGKTHDIHTENVRYFHVSKNKLQGDSDTKEEYRHGRWEVCIDPTIARYVDFIK